MSQQDRRELDDLVADLRDGQLSDAEGARLDVLLAESPEAREHYLQMMELHAELHWRFAHAAGDADPETPRGTWLARFFSRPLPLSTAVAALVMGLLITVLAFMMPLEQSTSQSDGDFDTPRIVAELTATHEAQRADGQVGTHDGALLPGGHRLRLLKGLAEVVYNDGVQVLLEGPCDFRIDALGSGTLRTGRLATAVPPGATGFSIDTPWATFTDLGTEFGVEIVEDESVRLEVYQGEVRVEVGPFAAADSREKVLLSTGSVATITPSGELQSAAAGAEARQIVGRFALHGNVPFALGQQVSRSPPIADQGFERPVQPAGEWKQASGIGDGSLDGAPWTFTDGAGITGNHSPFQMGASAREGQQHALIQASGSVKQTIGGFKPGAKYSLCLLAMARQGQEYGGNDLEVVLDAGQATEVVLLDIPEVTFERFTKLQSDKFVAEKEIYVLTIRASQGGGKLTGDRTTFVDYVWFNQLRSPPEPAAEAAARPPTD